MQYNCRTFIATSYLTGYFDTLTAHLYMPDYGGMNFVVLFNVSGVAHISEVILRGAVLVLRWMTPS